MADPATDATLPVARWLSRRGAEVDIGTRAVVARVAVSRAVERDWWIERTSLLVRYVDRRCDARHRRCDEMRARSEHLQAGARAQLHWLETHPVSSKARAVA